MNIRKSKSQALAAAKTGISECNGRPARVASTQLASVYATKAEAYTAIASYIHGFYNPTRLHSTLGCLSPNHCVCHCVI